MYLKLKKNDRILFIFKKNDSEMKLKKLLYFLCLQKNAYDIKLYRC